jgi:hypothetical protein
MSCRAHIPGLCSLLVATVMMAGAIGCSESKAASSVPSSNAAAAVGACGEKDLPDCPLQGWMKSTLRTYLNAKDTTRLAGALQQLADKTPPGYDGWRETAQGAAKAANTGDIPAVKAACKSCHDQHRPRFRNERRQIALF